MAQQEEFLGAGLDIEGWSNCAQEPKRQTHIRDMIDRGLILRSTFPLIMTSKFDKKDGKELLELVTWIMEQKPIIDPPWLGM